MTDGIIQQVIRDNLKKHLGKPRYSNTEIVRIHKRLEQELIEKIKQEYESTESRFWIRSDMLKLLIGDNKK